MPPRKITIITSDKAQKHHEHIKLRHDEIIDGLNQQSQRVSALRQSQYQEAQNINNQNMDFALRQRQVENKYAN